MTSRVILVDPFDMVVFGATGDLSARKLLPALYQRDRAGQIPVEARVVAVSRRAMADAEYVAWVREQLVKHVADFDEAVAERFLARIAHVTLDVTGEAGWSALGDVLAEHPERVRAFYLAVGPDLFGPICDRIGQHGLVTPKARVVVEKPFGHNVESAKALNSQLRKSVAERQIYRMDHFLGKETVQNIMLMRFANGIFEPLWNREHIDHIQITVAETVGVERRAGFYETTGAVRGRSTRPLAGCSRSGRFSASTIISARRRCRT